MTDKKRGKVEEKERERERAERGRGAKEDGVQPTNHPYFCRSEVGPYIVQLGVLVMRGERLNGAEKLHFARGKLQERTDTRKRAAGEESETETELVPIQDPIYFRFAYSRRIL